MTLTTTDQQYKHAIKRLYDYSLNCDHNEYNSQGLSGNPWHIFLDLSGYSAEYMDTMQAYSPIHLGHLERVMLAEALYSFNTHGYKDVFAWIDEAQADG